MRAITYRRLRVSVDGTWSTYGICIGDVNLRVRQPKHLRPAVERNDCDLNGAWADYATQIRHRVEEHESLL